MSHVRLCLLMRISKFDVFYCSLLMLCSTMVKSLQLWHPEASFVVAPCHTSQVIFCSCMTTCQSSVCRHWNNLRGRTRHLAISSTVAKQLLPSTWQEKTVGQIKRICSPAMARWALGLSTRALQLISVFSASPCLWIQPSRMPLN